MTTPAFAWGVGNLAFPYGTGGDDSYAQPTTAPGQQLANSAKSLSATAAPASVAGDSSSWDTYLKLAQLGLGAYNSFFRKPKFAQVPQSPQEQELMNLYINSLKNPATANNAAIVSSYAQQALGSMHPSWQSPKTFSGDVGYQGNPGFQFKMPTFGATTPPPPPEAPGPPTGASPSGIPGAQTPGVPGAGGNDPFYGMTTPGGGAQNMTWDDVKRIASQFGPTAMKLATDGSLVGLGITGAINFIKSHFGSGAQPPDPNPTYNGNPNPTGANWTTPVPPGTHSQQWWNDYYKQHAGINPGNDPLSGAQGISSILGIQGGGGADRKGFKAF